MPGLEETSFSHLPKFTATCTCTNSFPPKRVAKHTQQVNLTSAPVVTVKVTHSYHTLLVPQRQDYGSIWGWFLSEQERWWLGCWFWQRWGFFVLVLCFLCDVVFWVFVWLVLNLKVTNSDYSQFRIKALDLCSASQHGSTLQAIFLGKTTRMHQSKTPSALQ